MILIGVALIIITVVLIFLSSEYYRLSEEIDKIKVDHSLEPVHYDTDTNMIDKHMHLVKRVNNLEKTVDDIVKNDMLPKEKTNTSPQLLQYRAWVPELSRIIDVLNIDYETKKIFGDNYRRYFFKDIELMSSSGIQDINRNDIYEGDILAKLSFNLNESRIVKSLVVFTNGSFRLLAINPHLHSDYWHEMAYLTYLEAKSYKIIGNKYEDPELLESQNDDSIYHSITKMNKFV